MSRKGSKQHEDELKVFIEDLKHDGYRVIDLEGLSPDAIAVKDNKIIAVELLGSTYNPVKKKWRKDFTVRGKIRAYSMFDDVFVRVFHRNKRGLSKTVSSLTDGTQEKECL